MLVFLGTILVALSAAAMGNRSSEETTFANAADSGETSMPDGTGESAAVPAAVGKTYTAPGFTTDFNRLGVDPDDILSGGPPKDGIPAVDDPKMVTIDQAASWLAGGEPVILVRVGGEARIYPLQILTWHEIVNDELGDVPIAVTFCPLCNTGIVFDRRHQGVVLDFGTTGRLRFSNLIMYDRQDETWWQQATGEAIIGKRLGESLAPLPALTLSFDEAASAAPKATVLSRDTGYSRPYGSNPYEGYDNPESAPFLFRGPSDPRFGMLDRVLLLSGDDESRVFEYRDLEEHGAVNISMAGKPVVVLWGPGTASALDHRTIAKGRDVGAANAFRAELGGRTLTFRSVPGDSGRFTDEETGSLWDNAGTAREGPMKGQSLTPLPTVQHFWFSAYAFNPEAR
jgi:hypothetical protein